MSSVLARLYVFTVLWAVSACTGCSADRRPNVLLIVLDTTRIDHLSVYGYERDTTPHLARLAADSLVFHRAKAVSNWTLPTHASMFTGLYSKRHGARWKLPPFSLPVGKVSHFLPEAMSEDVPTLAEHLQKAGMQTAGIVGNLLYLHPRFGFARGFETYLPRKFKGRHGLPARVITDTAVEWLRRSGSHPEAFFLFLNYFDPHGPYQPPPPFHERFGDPAQYEWHAKVRGIPEAWRAAGFKRGTPLPPARRQYLIDLYDGEIAYMDEQIGRLLDSMRESGVYDQTMIIVTADHGESFGDHRGILVHNASMYESETAVPLLIKFPLSSIRGRRDDLVSHIDVAPTVLELLDLSVPPGLDGRSLLTRSPERALFAEHGVNPQFAQRYEWANREKYAMWRGNLKFIQYERWAEELYDLDTDASEQRDLSQSRAQAAQAMRGELSSWRGLSAAGPVAAPNPVVDEDSLEQLRALGYLADEDPAPAPAPDSAPDAAPDSTPEPKESGRQ